MWPVGGRLRCWVAGHSLWPVIYGQLHVQTQTSIIHSTNCGQANKSIKVTIIFLYLNQNFIFKLEEGKKAQEAIIFILMKHLQCPQKKHILIKLDQGKIGVRPWKCNWASLTEAAISSSWAMNEVWVIQWLNDSSECLLGFEGAIS